MTTNPPTPQPRRWRRGAALLAFGVALIALIAALFAAELVVRYRERHRPTLGGVFPLLYYQHGRLGHALVRDYDYFGHIHINREGFRGAEVSVAKSPGTLRIMAIGSSTTFDPGVSNDTAAWPARLQHWLRELAPAPSRRVEVINAGVPGYRVIDDLFRLTTDLVRYQPDVVIFYEGHNDLFGALGRTHAEPAPFTPTPDEIPSVTPWGRWLERHSLLYGKLVSRFQALRFQARGRRAANAGTGELAPQAVVDSGAARFERDVSAFLAVARSLNIPVVVPELVQVSGAAREEPDSTARRAWSHAVPFARPETVLLGYAQYNHVLRNLAQRYGATWIPTQSFQLAGIAWYQDGDPIHFNDRGADRMARELAAALVANRALDARPRQQ